MGILLLPLGNGRLTAMLFGSALLEQLHLNDDTLWLDGPYDPNPQRAHVHLPRIQQIIFVGHYQEAGEICNKLQGRWNQSYSTIGDLRLRLENDGPAISYRRELYLNEAIARVSYHVEDKEYLRETFVPCRVTCW